MGAGIGYRRILARLRGPGWRCVAGWGVGARKQARGHRGLADGQTPPILGAGTPGRCAEALRPQGAEGDERLSHSRWALVAHTRLTLLLKMNTRDTYPEG